MENLTDDVLARGPEMAVDFVTSKLANAAGKMAKLIGTDLFLDGQGTGSSTLSVDGKADVIAVVKFDHMLESPSMLGYAEA